MKLTIVVSALLLTLSSLANAIPYDPSLNGNYDTLQPERGRSGQPTKQIILQMNQLNGQDVLVTAGCHPGCVPIIYTYQDEPSKTLKKDVYFSKAGIYLIQVGKGTFVSVIPDAELGMKAWQNLRFVNVYAKQGNAFPFDLKGATEFAITQSKNIMNTGTLTTMAHGTGEYHIAAPIKVLGRQYQTTAATFKEGKNKVIDLQACNTCPTDTFQYLPDESSITGTPTYKDNRGDILFDVSDGVLIWANFSGDYGKALWQESDHFNLYAKDIGYVRSIRSDKTKQTKTDELIQNYAQLVKAEMDQRAKLANEQKIATQELPPKGLSDKVLEKEATEAAQRWADSWGWKETIAYAYITSADWGIQHHPLTGLVTGRHVRGIIVMRRPDGLCSFHYASFGQQYDGSQFRKTYMLGLMAGQIKLGCEKI